MTAETDSHSPVFREIKLPGKPLTSSQKKIERKQKLRELIEDKIGKDLQKVQKRCENKKLLIDVTFSMIESIEKGRSKTDLDNLLKILLDVLSVNMVNGQKPILGVGLIQNDSQIYEIRCKKIPAISENDEGITIRISRFNKTSSYPET